MRYAASGDDPAVIGQSNAPIVLDIVRAGVEQTSMAAAALAAANTMADLCGCERAAIGWVRDTSTRVIAISGVAAVDIRMPGVRELAAAMDEAWVHEDAVLVPGAHGHGFTAHRALLATGGVATVGTMPLKDGDEIIGMLILEHASNTALQQRMQALSESIAILLGVVLMGKKTNSKKAHSCPWATPPRGFSPSAVLGGSRCQRYCWASFMYLAFAKGP